MRTVNKKIFLISLQKINFLLILVFTVLHIAYIDTPFVNLEWVYRQGTEYFLKSDNDALEKYFFYQANPLTYSFLTSKLVEWTEFNQFAVYRIPALVGGILLLTTLSRYHNPWLVLIVGLNPMIWIYAGRSYSELLAVGCMSIAYLCRHSTLKAGPIAALAGVVKYHALPFILLNTSLNWLIINWRESFRNWYKHGFLTNIFIVSIFVIFLVIYQQKFGFWIAPEKFRNLHGNISLSESLNNFFSYGFYLSGMFFLTVPAFLKIENIKIKLALLALSIFLAVNNQNLGEMDFGSFQQLLGNEVILLIKIIGFWNFLLCLQIFWKDEESRILLLTILGYIILLSLTRPANRYLIFVVPFWAMLVCQHISISRLFWWGYISVLAGLNLFATLYQVSNATASANMAEWAVKNDVKINLGGIVYAHVGNFSHYDPNSPLVVSLAGSQDGEILHEEQVSVLSFPIRRYILTNTDSQ